jgi:hypothetical protein
MAHVNARSDWDPMFEQLQNLILHLVHYRKTLDRIFSKPAKTSSSLRQYFFDLLVCTSQLYLDYLLLLKDSPSYETKKTKFPRQKLPVADIHSEKDLRERFRRALESSPHWEHFIPDNPFSHETRLHTLDDYLHRFTHHLPEIYEETFRIESDLNIFLENLSDEVLAHLLVSLQHMARNHISFVLQTLEWAAEDISSTV